MDRHLTLLGVLHIALSALLLLVALIVFVAVVGGGLLSADALAIGITTTVGTLVALFFVLIALPGIVAGIGLLRRRPWARTLTLVIAVLNLLNFPFGTAIAVYSFWVLMHRDTAALLGST